MRPLGIFALGAAALVAANCGARTPFDDAEPGAGGTSGRGATSSGATATGSSTSTGSTGSSTTSGVTTSGVTTSGVTTSGVTTSGTTSGVTTSGSTSGSTVSTGTSGVTTSGTTGTFTSGATTVGAGGAVTTTGTFAATTGSTGGATGGFGGRSGAGGSIIVVDAGPPSNPLLGILPGVRPTPQCTQCVDVRCDNTSACSSDPGCLAGTKCYFAACAAIPQQDQLPCALKCFNGNVGELMNAFQAVSCVYGACGVICTRGREP